MEKPTLGDLASAFAIYGIAVGVIVAHAVFISVAIRKMHKIFSRSGENS